MCSFATRPGKAVPLGDYFGKRPVIWRWCTTSARCFARRRSTGWSGALEMVKFNPGKDFNVVFVSIDPSETPEMAAEGEGAVALKHYGRPETARWMAFPDRAETADRCAGAAMGFGYYKVRWAGWEDDAVCACQRD